MLGKTLAHYEIKALLGKGGMGEVYRALDTKLGRDVALKVLPRELASDPERAMRFAREARTLASLQHPNVAAIFGFEEADGVRFLTMELVEGRDLSECVPEEGLPTDEAIRIGLQIASGLEAAHQKNIVHRDLKPANVKIGSDGAVKILDFGLARAYAADSPDGGDPESSPTITAAMTHAGVILGTAAYMSPEQARGRTIDNRADIWAFGVVMFEMLSGRRLFGGETVSDTLASVLKTEIDWRQLPADLPPRIRTLLVRCLNRDRDRRLRDIGEARIALEDELSGAPDLHLESALDSGMFAASAVIASSHGSARRWLPLAGAMLAGALLGLAATQVVMPREESLLPLRKLELDVAKPMELQRNPVISPDGRAVALVLAGEIVVRELDARELRRYPVTEEVLDLFWSPDGLGFAYITSRRLYRVDPSSGQQQVVCEARNVFNSGSGGSWSFDGTIVFSQADSAGLFRVSDRGGDPKQILPTNHLRETDLHDPHVLPGGRGVLFVPHSIENPFNRIELWADGERRVLIDLADQTLADPWYSPTGHIIFRRAPTNPGIWAVPFSLDRLEIIGEPFIAAADGSDPSVAGDATLVYLSGLTSSALRVTWNDEMGRETGDSGDIPFTIGYFFPALAPGGQLACASIDDEANPDLWIFDVARKTRTRLTFADGREEWPVWTPSGESVIYHVRPAGSSAIESLRVVRVPADGTGTADTLAVGFIPAVSPDGRFVLFSRAEGPGSWSSSNLCMRPLDPDDATVTPVVRANGLQMDGRVSPDGKFVAYTSDESGEFEIYLTRFPSGEGRWQASVDGGMWARWNAAGDRLFYARGNDLMQVEVSLGATPRLGTPSLLVQRPALGMVAVGNWAPGFDVGEDGRNLLFFRDSKKYEEQATKIVVVQNWISEFEDDR